MNVVEQILMLFDELDGYESIDLIEALAERGYELKVNHQLEKEKSHQIYGLFLDGFNEEHKIQTIKLVRNTGPENRKFCSGYNDWGLRDAKTFVESPTKWPKIPFLWGTYSAIKILYNRLNQEHNPHITLKVKEITDPLHVKHTII
jgi:ribosomal protein L7/L12